MLSTSDISFLFFTSNVQMRWKFDWVSEISFVILLRECCLFILITQNVWSNCSRITVKFTTHSQQLHGNRSEMFHYLLVAGRRYFSLFGIIKLCCKLKFVEYIYWIGNVNSIIHKHELLWLHEKQRNYTTKREMKW